MGRCQVGLGYHSASSSLHRFHTTSYQKPQNLSYISANKAKFRRDTPIVCEKIHRFLHFSHQFLNFLSLHFGWKFGGQANCNTIIPGTLSHTDTCLGLTLRYCTHGSIVYSLEIRRILYSQNLRYVFFSARTGSKSIADFRFKCKIKAQLGLRATI